MKPWWPSATTIDGPRRRPTPWMGEDQHDCLWPGRPGGMKVSKETRRLQRWKTPRPVRCQECADGRPLLQQSCSLQRFPGLSQITRCIVQVPTGPWKPAPGCLGPRCLPSAAPTPKPTPGDSQWIPSLADLPSMVRPWRKSILGSLPITHPRSPRTRSSALLIVNRPTERVQQTVQPESTPTSDNPIQLRNSFVPHQARRSWTPGFFVDHERGHREWPRNGPSSPAGLGAGSRSDPADPGEPPRFA
jgi:hypothetical protein